MKEVRMDIVIKFFHNKETMKEVAIQLGYLLPDDKSLSADIILGII
jgi:hypothetical protein